MGGADRRIKPLPEGDRNDAVELAVQHQSRDRDRADPRIRADLILHQKTNRDQWIAQLGDLGGGSERRFQDQPSDRLFARQRRNKTAIPVSARQPGSNAKRVVLVSRSPLLSEATAPQRRIDLGDSRTPGRDVPTVERPKVDAGSKPLTDATQPGNPGMGGFRD